MKKTFIILLLIISCFGFNCRTNKEISNKQDNNLQEVDFCSVMENPESYKSKVIETTVNIYGFHSLVIYKEVCCAVKNVVRVDGIDYEMRQQMGEKEQNLNIKKTSADFKGTITIAGKL